jgi:soluble lytic murein transglycosylase
MRSVNVRSGVFAVLLLLVCAPLWGSPLRPPRELAPYVEGMHRGQCSQLLVPLEALAARTDATGARAAYLLATCLQRTGRVADARVAFEAAAARHPTLAAHARLAAAALALEAGEPQAALPGIRAAAGRPSRRHRSLLLEAESLVRLRRGGEAEQILRGLIPLLTDRGDLARAWWWRAQAATGRASASYYSAVVWGFPETTFAAQAARRLAGMAQPLRPPAVARLYRARWLARSDRSAEAERELALAVRGPLLPPDAADAWYRLGFLRLPSRSRQAARDFLNGARVAHHADRALYWAGRALITAGRRADGTAVWRRLLRSHPASAWSARALYGMGLAAERRGAGAEAERLYHDLARRFPHTLQGQEAAWRRGWWRYRRGMMAEAETVFLNAARTHPDSMRAPAALYWAAMARARRGADSEKVLAELAATYPLSYYGQQARRRMGIPAPIPPVAPPAEPGDQFGPAHEELGALGLHRDALEEITHAPRAQYSAHFAAFHLARAGQVSASVSAAAAALAAAHGRQEVADREVWMLAYPAAHRETVLSAAGATGVDPYLILAVIREESRFDPDAVSFAGATGLMQLLPSTARYLIRGRTVTSTDLFRPEVNVRYGAVYLQRMLARFDGNVVLALAAYNAGPGAAARFARTLPQGHEADFIERIPIDETRAYIRRVLESYGIYRWLYR